MKSCLVCCQEITDKKSYNSIERAGTLGLRNILCEVVNGTQLDQADKDLVLCRASFNKLNRISKIDFDLKHRIQKLQEERTLLVDGLKKLRDCQDTAFPGTHSHSTPTKNGEKTLIAHTPTPNKRKIQRSQNS